MLSRRRLVVAGLVAATSGAIGPPSPVRSEEGVHSSNLTHVVNVPQRLGDASGRPAGTPTAGDMGSDIEFATLDITESPRARAAGVSGVREYALGGSLRNGLQIVDITTPTKPVTVGVYPCTLAQGDVQVFTRGTSTYATYTADYDQATTSRCYVDAAAKGFSLGPAGSTRGLGTFIVDITDPYAPKTVSFIHVPDGSHNQTVDPSGRFLYNSNNELGLNGERGVQNGHMELFDITDLTKPTKVGELDLGAGLDSHDVSFRADGKRAYVAAVSHSLVLDTADLASPKIVGRIVDPSITIHHQAEPVRLIDPVLGQRDFLVVTDEFGGGSAGSACPGGALHVFDVTGPLENAPVKVGVWEAPQVKAAGPVPGGGSAWGCTSHVLRFYPERKLMTIAWYNLGVHVADISSLPGLSVGVSADRGNAGAGIKEIGYFWFPNSNTWSAKTNKFEADGSFYLYGNDIARGLDVFRFSANAAPAADGGTWSTPTQFASKAQVRAVRSVSLQLPRCVLRAERAL